MLDYKKVVVFLLAMLVSLFSWMGKNVYDATQINGKRLTIVESTLIDRTEAVRKLTELEYRVSTLEKSPK